jgi:hypothetical protein
MWNFGWAKA